MKKLFLLSMIFLMGTFFLLSSAEAKNLYQVKVDSGVAFSKDVKIVINDKSYNNEAVFGGQGAETYGFDNLAAIPLQDGENVLAFTVTADGKQAERKNVPVLFRIYKDRKLFSCVVGSYSSENDIGKSFSLKIPGISQIKTGDYFFFSNLPQKNVFVFTTGFANGSVNFDGENLYGGLPADLLWVYFLSDDDLSRPYLVLKYNTKGIEQRFEKYPHYISEPYFCLADTKKGVVYQKTLSVAQIKAADDIFVKITASKYDLITKTVIVDQARLKNIEKMVWPTVKKIAEKIRISEDEVNQLNKQNKEAAVKKSEELLASVVNYLIEINPEMIAPDFMAVSFVQDCSSLAKDSPAKYKLKCFDFGRQICVEIYYKSGKTDKGTDYPIAIISLLFDNKGGDLKPVYPF